MTLTVNSVDGLMVMLLKRRSILTDGRTLWCLYTKATQRFSWMQNICLPYKHDPTQPKCHRGGSSGAKDPRLLCNHKAGLVPCTESRRDEVCTSVLLQLELYGQYVCYVYTEKKY